MIGDLITRMIAAGAEGDVGAAMADWRCGWGEGR
jgi:hypothetical protein